MTGGVLAGKVADRLKDGPAHTLALAREVLGLSGHPGAASAAIFALLGNDPRFRVDAGGDWTLDETAGGLLLADLRYAVVDVETTGGGVHRGHKMTEIAIVEVAGGQIVDRWSTLLNPGRSIMPIVERLTGITAAMVDSAPFFEHVAPEVAERLEGRIFVAHNAGFDRGFVRAELVEALGEAPPLPSLCTVRMTRGLVPKLRRRNLDAVCQHYGVRIEGRHRAWGDALATAQVLVKLLDVASGQGIMDLDTLRRMLRRRARQKKKARKPKPETE